MGDEERCKAEGVCKGGPQRCKAGEGCKGGPDWRREGKRMERSGSAQGGGVGRGRRSDKTVKDASVSTYLAIKDVDFNKTRPFCATHPCTIVTGAIEPPTSVKYVLYGSPPA